MFTRETLKQAAEDYEMTPTFLFFENNEVSGKSREYLLRTIGALSLHLIKKQAGEKFGTLKNPNRHAIIGEINGLLADLGVSSEGQSKTKLYQVLEEAIDLTLKKPLQ